MSWDESDTDLKEEWNKSIVRQQDANTKSRQERDYQNKINALKMQQVQIINDVTVDGKTVQVPTTGFVMPKNFAGDTMDTGYRDSQKADLIKNIKQYTGEDDG